MNPTHRILVLSLVLALGRPANAQGPCNTWQVQPPAPVEPNPIVALAYDPVTQELYQATDDGFGGHNGTQPWVGRRAGNGWVTMLDPAGFSNGSVYGLEMLDLGTGSSLYTFGSWTSLAGHTDVLRWNGASFVNEPDVPGTPTALAVFDDGGGPALYASANAGVFRLTGGNWVSIGVATVGSYGLTSLAVHDDGAGPALYVAGHFSSIGGVTVADVARWNGVSWSALGSGISGQPTPTLNSLRVMRLLSVREAAGPRLYAAGSFLMMDGQPANSIARFDGTSWSGIGTGIAQTIYEVPALASFDDGTGRGAALYATGLIATLPQTPPFLKRFDGGVWSDVPLGPSQGALGEALLVADLPETTGPDLLATIYSPTTGRTTARFEACDQVGRVYCLGDGSGTDCPCGNSSAPGAGSGCLNSFGTAGRLVASGMPSVSADSVTLDATGLPPTVGQQPTFFQGTLETNGGAGVTFGDGLRCASGTVIRLGTVTAQNGAAQFGFGVPGTGLVSVHGAVPTAGATRTYQLIYRNAAAFCTASTFNLTNGVSLVWAP